MMEPLHFVKQYIYLDNADSTNTHAKFLTDISDGGLTVIRAAKQRGGRGRSGKAYFSDHSGGLWVSIIAPIADISEHFSHNRAISLAILASLKDIYNTAPVSIKWPNDIYWKDKKITGILLENTLSNPNVIIIGFGINVNIAADDFPEDLRPFATSALIETGREFSLDGMLSYILKSYQQYINSSKEAVHKLYLDNLYKKGHPATVDGYAGIFTAVEPDGRLRLQTAGGDMFFLTGALKI